MLLVIDIGNTSTVVGVYDNASLIQHWRIGTKKARTADEYGIMLMGLFAFSRTEASNIDGAIISSVVPPLTDVFLDMVKRYFKIPPLIIGPGIRTGMPILTDNPKEVGADRIVNAVAAFERHKRAVIVVDFGTATTFDYISPKGEYMGGAITPGMSISLDALFQRAAKLPRIELVKPKRVVGKDTIESMQAGIFFGYLGLIDKVVKRMKEEVGGSPMVVATGGSANIIVKECDTIEEFDEFLTLDGLRIIYNKNQ